VCFGPAGFCGRPRLLAASSNSTARSCSFSASAVFTCFANRRALQAFFRSLAASVGIEETPHAGAQGTTERLSGHDGPCKEKAKPACALSRQVVPGVAASGPPSRLLRRPLHAVATGVHFSPRRRRSERKTTAPWPLNATARAAFRTASLCGMARWDRAQAPSQSPEPANPCAGFADGQQQSEKQ
jgi:hypothetical protein